MPEIDPIPNKPAAIITINKKRYLIIADYHAGIEIALRSKGVEIASRATNRRNRLHELLAEYNPDELVILGDLAHGIGKPHGIENEEIATLINSIDRPITLVKGNHDGKIEDVVDIPVTDSRGKRIDTVGFAHGHTYPSEDVLQADLLCIGHEHPAVRLEDTVGGSRMERVWLRGQLNSTGFSETIDDDLTLDGDLVVFPAFNSLSGSTWINIEGQEFLSPFLPDGISNNKVYLLDGTLLGQYQKI
ncbi:MAG: metallophosphoesterase [Halobacteriaceae archaeon]